jgi:flagellar motor switch protein FliG
VLLRIATLDGIQSAALRELDDVMTELLSGNANVKRKAVVGVRAAAEILNHLSNQHEESAIESVRGYDDDLAQKIIDEMFMFDKLVELDDRASRFFSSLLHFFSVLLCRDSLGAARYGNSSCFLERLVIISAL